MLVHAQAVDIVSATMCGPERMGSATNAAMDLINASMEQWKVEEGDYRDDITATVVRLDDVFPPQDGSPPASQVPASQEAGSLQEAQAASQEAGSSQEAQAASQEAGLSQ